MMDLTLRTAPQTNVGSSENKGTAKAGVNGFSTLTEKPANAPQRYSPFSEQTGNANNVSDTAGQSSALPENTVGATASEPLTDLALAVTTAPALDVGELVLDVDGLALNVDNLALDGDQIALDGDQAALDLDLDIDIDLFVDQAASAEQPIAATLPPTPELTEAVQKFAANAANAANVDPTNLANIANANAEQAERIFEQVAHLSQAHARTLSSSSSLTSAQQETFTRSSVLGDAIRLANSNVNTQNNPNVAVNLSAVSTAVDTVSLSPVSASNPLLSMANPLLSTDSSAAKIMEWAKIDLSNTTQNVESKEAASSRIGEKLMGILQDRINLQASNNIKTAQIRLDPPDLGTITLNVRVDGDKVNVNIASQSSLVREALVQTSERLRNDLVSQHFVDVSVDISSGEQQESKQEHYHQAQITTNSFNPEVLDVERDADEFIVRI